MKKIIFIVSLFFVFFSANIHAARFGGGKSFGQHSSSRNSNSSTRPQQHPQQQQPPQQNHNQATPPQKSSWTSKLLPALAGLSVGALLGSLLGGHGLAGGLSSIFMIFAGLAVAGIVFYIIRNLFASKKENKNFHHFQQTAAQTDNGQTFSGNAYQQPINTYTPTQNNTAYVQSPFFNKDEFLRTAKTIFIRMQTAYDNKNLTDIRTFTTPEVFAEIQMQIQERGSAANQTEVIQIHSSFLDEYEANNSGASVIFSGQLREEPNTPPVAIREVWHFIRDEQNQWLIAGIEQKSSL